MINSLLYNFLQNLDNICKKDNIGYIEAIINFCEKNNIEIENIAEAINKIPYIIQKLQIEAEDFHFLKRTNRLPI